MLNIAKLSFGYKRRQTVLDDFNLSIESGGIYGLLGPNGAGKSTLLYLISGALTAQSGNVTYNGIDTRLRLPQTLSDIFLVSEEFHLPSVTLERYVSLNASFYPKFSMETLRRNLEIFELPTNLHLGKLSMGQKKKVFMSFALACNTSLLLMDEPTNGLDIPGKRAFRKFIASGMTDDRTFIISTHQVRDIDRLLDHVLIMNEQNLIFNHSINEIQQQLQFLLTDNKDTIATALHCIPGIGGTNVMTINNTDNETDVNLELLFDFAIKNTEKLNRIFSNNENN